MTSRSGVIKQRSSRSKELSARERARVFNSRSARRNQHLISGAASGVAKSLGPIGFAHAHRTAKDDVFMAFQEVQPEQLDQTRLIDTDFGRPVESFHSAFFLEASLLQPVG